MNDNIMSIGEAAAYLRCSVATLRKFRDQDVGPESFLLNGRVMYDRDGLDDWVALRRRATSRGGKVAVSA